MKIQKKPLDDVLNTMMELVFILWLIAFIGVAVIWNEPAKFWVICSIAVLLEVCLFYIKLYNEDNLVDVDSDRSSVLIHCSTWNNWESYELMTPDGLGFVRLSMNDGTWFLSDLYVKKEYRGLGIGGKLVDKALELSKGERIEFTVNPDNKETYPGSIRSWLEFKGLYYIDY